MTDPWTTDGTWLRGALHAHTTGSDGELPPRHLAGHYGFGVAAHEEELQALAQEHAGFDTTASWIEKHKGVAYLAHPY